MLCTLLSCFLTVSENTFAYVLIYSIYTGRLAKHELFFMVKPKPLVNLYIRILGTENRQLNRIHAQLECHSHGGLPPPRPTSPLQFNQAAPPHSWLLVPSICQIFFLSSRSMNYPPGNRWKWNCPPHNVKERERWFQDPPPWSRSYQMNIIAVVYLHKERKSPYWFIRLGVYSES